MKTWILPLLVRWRIVNPPIAPKARKPRAKRKPAVALPVVETKPARKASKPKPAPSHPIIPMNPASFKPKHISDFIGPARSTAEILDKLIARSAPTGDPIKVMFHGDPGIGKSALVDYLLANLGADQWSITKLNGTQLTIDRLEAWAATLCYRELSGGYKVLRIEEMDKASAQAQVRLLTVMDDLPRHVAILGTSNRKVEDVEKRLVSRFQVFALTGPPQDELRHFLTRWPLTSQVIDRISTFACGNVRLALFEAQTALDASL